MMFSNGIAPLTCGDAGRKDDEAAHKRKKEKKDSKVVKVERNHLRPSHDLQAKRRKLQLSSAMDVEATAAATAEEEPAAAVVVAAAAPPPQILPNMVHFLISGKEFMKLAIK